MLLEIKKEKGRFILLNPPANTSNRFFIEVSKIIDDEKKISTAPTKAYSEIKRLAEKYPDNEFFAISAEMTPPDYHTEDLENTENLLKEGLKNKYHF